MHDIRENVEHEGRSLSFRIGALPLVRIILPGLVCAVISAGTAFLVSNQLPKVFEARVSVVSPTMADTFAEVAESRGLLQRVATRLGLQMTPETLADHVSASASKTSALLTIVVVDGQAAEAAAIANAISDELVQMAPSISGYSADAQSSIDRDILTARTQIEETEAAIATLVAKTELSTTERGQLATLQSQLVTLLGVRSSLLTLRVSTTQSGLTSLGEAQAPTKSSSPQVLLATLLGGVVGLVIGAGAAFAVGSARSSAGGRQAAESAIGSGTP